MTRSARIPALLAGAAAIGSACTAKSTSDPPAQMSVAIDGGTDDSALMPQAVDGAPEPGDATPAGAPPALLRVAQMSPDLPPIDVCLAVHGTGAFEGPLLAQMAGDAGVDSGTPALEFAQVSAYLSVTAGQYDARLVPAGTVGCDAASSLADGTNLPPLEYDTSGTLLVAGDASPAGADSALTLVVLPDDAVLAGGASSLRAVNAVPSAPSLDFGFGSFATEWLPLLTAVGFASASMHVGPGEGAVDSDGYLPIGQVSGQVLSARASAGATSDTAVGDVAIPVGSIATVIAVGGKTGDATHPPAIFLCIDNQPAGGLLADCSIASATGAEGPDQ
ncbi:MAG: DUF4397 domain-containing protein [Polyangiaceae bacterium]|jgi:hypothetical protein